jgi:solute carrier family 30 (zinc transporter), member 2
MMGFVIAMAGIKLGERRSDAHMSFGYHRAELVGTLVSVISIWIMTIWLLVAATERFFIPPMVQGSLMFIVAVIGLIFNIIQIQILHGGSEHFHLGTDLHADEGDCGHGHSHGDKKEDEKDHGHAHPAHGDHEGHAHPAHAVASADDGASNLNMDAATLHVLGDLLSSVGVIIASIFIYFWPSMWIMDPICTYIFAIFVSYTTLPTV